MRSAARERCGSSVRNPAVEHYSPLHRDPVGNLVQAHTDAAFGASGADVNRGSARDGSEDPLDFCLRPAARGTDVEDGHRVFALWRHVRFETSRLPAARCVSAAAKPLLVPDLATPEASPIRRRAHQLARGRELTRAARRARLRRLRRRVPALAVSRHERSVPTQRTHRVFSGCSTS